MRTKICKELKQALKNPIFFDCVGGCGIDMSKGKSNCMDKNGLWFKFCPFCGKKIVSEYSKKLATWTWWEEKLNK